MIDFIHELIYKLKKLFSWTPVIWNDRDWDHEHIFIILKKKIEQVRKRQEFIKFYIGWENDVKYMKLCEKLLDMLISEDCKYEYCSDDYLIYMGKIQSLLFKILDKQILKWWD